MFFWERVILITITRLKLNKSFYILIIILLLLTVGCSNPFAKKGKSQEEKVYIYVVHPDQSPVQDFPITITRTGESAPEIGIILEPTDEDGKTEAILTVGATYEAYLVIDDDTTQYEEFTVLENVEDNEFTFMLED